LRWIYGKPAHPKPQLGKPPAFLNENAIQIPTRSRANRAIDLLRRGSSQAAGALDEYFTTLAESLEAFRIPMDKFNRETFDEPIVESVGSFLPYRDEFITVVSTLARYPNMSDEKQLRTLFEKLIPYMFRPKTLMQYNNWYWDNFAFIIHEMFLYTIAFLLKQERFELVFGLMSQSYYVGDAIENSQDRMQSFGIIRQHLESLGHRNKRLQLNRLSLRADMLERRSHASGLPFADVMQADFVLFFFDAITSHRQQRRPRWWPETLVYYREYAPPFEIFARAESQRYFHKISPLIAVSTKAELGELFQLFGVQNSPLYLPTWNMFHSVSLQGAMNFEKLATKP
jgi:hypothetical protein